MMFMGKCSRIFLTEGKIKMIRLFYRVLALCLVFMILTVFPAFTLAEEPAGEDAWEEGLIDEAEIAALEAEGIEVEGMEIEDGDEDWEVVPEPIPEELLPAIQRVAELHPLYKGRIKPFVANGSVIRMRAKPDQNSAVVCSIDAYQPITVYEVLPSFVLAVYVDRSGKENCGYVIRTWVDENMETIDPEHTPPYGVVPSKYVATLTEKVNVYSEPDLSSDVNDIHPGAGSKIAILDFMDGFAKVLIWRSWGYVDARYLTDLVTVSPTLEPLSADTPIAAFCSFFAYNTGAEGNDGRCKNIVRSCELMTRTMQVGESLNFNSQIGPYKKANGYFPAPVLINGGSQLGYGGGTCQSSSTLYNTVRQIPGVTILYRKPHGPGCARYLPMHQDAAVGNDTLNFKFRNDCDFPIRILAESTGEGTICIQIFRENP